MKIWATIACVLALAGAAAAAPARKSTTVPAKKPTTAPAEQFATQDVPQVPEQDLKKVVLVLDASAKMDRMMPALKEEMRQFVDYQPADRQITFIFYQGGKAIAAADHLLAANDQNKQKLKTFIDGVSARGVRDPVAALRQAMALKPELIFFLSGGDFADAKAVRETVGKLNADKKVRINTIAFVSDKAADTDFNALLQRISKDSGGIYKNVMATELKQ